MYAMSNEVLRRPIILDGEIIEEGNRSINPLIPISADIDGSTLFIKFSKAIGNVDIAVKEITDAKSLFVFYGCNSCRSGYFVLYC